MFLRFIDAVSPLASYTLSPHCSLRAARVLPLPFHFSMPAAAIFFLSFSFTLPISSPFSFSSFAMPLMSRYYAFAAVFFADMSWRATRRGTPLRR